MLATLCLRANHSVRKKSFKFHYVLILLVWWGFFGFLKSSTWASTFIFRVLNFADSCSALITHVTPVTPAELVEKFCLKISTDKPLFSIVSMRGGQKLCSVQLRE